MPAASVLATLICCVAATPSPLAAVKVPRATPAGRLPTTLTALTRLSASVALTTKLDAVPDTATWSGQLGRMGALPPPPPPHRFSGLPVLRGAGVPAAKSAALLLVSVQPLAARRLAVVLLRMGAGAAPSAPVAVGPQEIRSS